MRRRLPLTNRHRYGGGLACLLLSLILAASATGCRESDEQLVEDVGVTRLLFIDSGLLGQSISQERILIQGIRWEVSEAMLDIDGAFVDLLAGGDQCVTIDTVNVDPFSPDPCANGIVIEPSTEDDPFNLRLFLTIDRIDAHRAITPNYLDEDDPTYREDGDAFDTAGIPGGIFENLCLDDSQPGCRDNCPEIPNPDQSLVCVTNLGLRDTDGDGIADGFDNCVYISNEDQEDTLGLAAEGTQDGIGDACETGPSALGSQVISVELTGGSQLSFENFPLVQPEQFPTFIVIDFNTQETLTNCDLDSDTCDLNTDEIRVCTTSNPFAALEGCFQP